MLRVGLEVPQTQSEGPGVRYAVWLQGCPLRCKGCCNPHLLVDEGGALVAPETLAGRIVQTAHIEGVTLLGGEPFAQAAELTRLLAPIRAAGLSTMAFSGFTLAELRARSDASALLACLDLLVDGRYEQDEPDTKRRWIGSRNQVVHFLTERYDPNDPTFVAPDSVEIRLVDGVLTINGHPWGRALGVRQRSLRAADDLPDSSIGNA